MRSRRFEHEGNKQRHDKGETEALPWVTSGVTSRTQAEALRESESRYRTLFDSIDEGFCIIEVIFDENNKPIDYLFLETNPSFVKQTGLFNAPGKRMRELAPKHEQYWFEIYGRVALTGEPVRFQNRAEQLNRWYDVYAFRFGFPENRQVAILFNDISERKQATEALRRSEQRLRAVIENLAEGLIVVDPDGASLHWNRAALRMHGYERREDAPELFSLAVDLYELRRLDGTTLALEQRPISRLLRGEAMADYEVIVRRKADGRERIFSYGGILVRESNGEVAMGLLTIRDVTELKKVQQALIRSEKLASVGRMAATIAHEINNPISAAMNALFLASGTPAIPDFCRRYLEIADQELRRIAHITKQTLGFYRESGLPDAVYLPAIVDDILGLYASKLKNKLVRVEQRYRDCEMVFGIDGELRQVVSNLVGNSIDALGSAGALHIRIGPWNMNRPMVRMTIADTGGGITQENLKQIFEPFFSTKESLGTGLGLWVTKELVKKHEGSIRVRSRLGMGTVFSIWLPTDRRHQNRAA